MLLNVPDAYETGRSLLQWWLAIAAARLESVRAKLKSVLIRCTWDRSAASRHTVSDAHGPPVQPRQPLHTSADSYFSLARSGSWQHKGPPPDAPEDAIWRFTAAWLILGSYRRAALGFVRSVSPEAALTVSANCCCCHIAIPSMVVPYIAAW